MPKGGEAVPVGAFGGGALRAAESLRVVVWNVHKGLDARLEGDLAALARERTPHLFAFQESRPDLRLPEGYGGHHATSFVRRLKGKHEGVMTLSRVAPSSAHRVRSDERELFVLTPKAALISEYPLDDGRMLHVVNVHGLNFDPSGRQLARQLEGLRERLAHIEGPLVVCGDFNTWNEARLAAARGVAHDLGLDEVAPDVPGGRKGHIRGGRLGRALGLDPRLHLDRLFVRGLTPLRSTWLEQYESSDHAALFAELRFDRARATGARDPLVR
ncbi:MAG: endonuclease/exonuclease/phosphatase family protein [Planctomycetota bacterium]